MNRTKAQLRKAAGDLLKEKALLRFRYLRLHARYTDTKRELRDQTQRADAATHEAEATRKAMIKLKESIKTFNDSTKIILELVDDNDHGKIDVRLRIDVANADMHSSS